jgi:hypothetical protein
MPKKNPTPTKVESIRHKDKRPNIPTAKHVFFPNLKYLAALNYRKDSKVDWCSNEFRV